MEPDVLVGRASERAILQRALADACAGSGGVVLVEGDAGVGKTSLAAALVRHARPLGVRTAWGACLEGEGAAPYRPWRQVLRSLSLPVSRLGEPGGGETTNRFQAFDETVQLLADAAGSDGLVIVIDDLHWSDLPSARLFQFAASAVAETRLLLVGLYRAGEAFAQHGLARVLSQVRRERTASQLTLGGLATAEVAELATRELRRAPDDALLRAVAERAEGNPLFVLELVRLAQASGRIDHRLPRGIREIIARRLDTLPEAARRALRQASVLGRELTAGLLSGMVGDPPAQLLDALDDAISAAIILVGDGGTLRFDHALTQEVAYAELAATERQRLHAGAASAVRAARGEVDAWAHHLRQAAPLGGADEALDATLLAARRARNELAFEHAVYQYRAAIGLLGLVPSSAVRRQELLLEIARCEFRAGAVEDAWRTCRAAADLGRADGDAATVADAATVLRGLANSSVTDEIHLLCREALAMLNGTDPVRQARVLAQLAVTADPFSDQIEPDLAERAVRSAEATGDPDARFLALQARRTELTDLRCSPHRLTLGERVSHLDEFPRRAREWIIAASGNADLCVRLGDRAAAPASYTDLLPFETRQVTAGADSPSRGPVALYLGKLAGLQEDWDAAETHLRTALELSTAMGARPHQARTHLEIARMLLSRRRARDTRTAQTHLNTALRIARDLGMRRVERAAAALVGGGRGDASPLSPREREVAALVADGLSNRQIAGRLHLSERTAENHVTHILNKLGFDSRARIAAWYAAGTAED